MKVCDCPPNHPTNKCLSPYSSLLLGGWRGTEILKALRIGDLGAAKIITFRVIHNLYSTTPIKTIEPVQVSTVDISLVNRLDFKPTNYSTFACPDKL